MMKDFKKFLISAVAVVGLVFILNESLGIFLDNKAVFVDQQKYNRIERATEDLAILGASRANNQYITNLIKDSLGVSTYNYGVGAQNVYTNYAILDLLVHKSKQKPKYVIWDFYFIDILDCPGWNTEKNNTLYSAYNESATVKEVVNLQGGKTVWLLKYLRLYKFNSKLPRVLIENKIEQRNEILGGYIPLTVEYKNGIEEYEEDRTTLDKQKLEYVAKVFELCKSNNIQLFVFISPGFYLLRDDPNDWAKVIEAKCKEGGIPFFNYEQDPYFLSHPEWFYNTLHLNDNGSKEYTSKIINDIKPILKSE